MMRFELDFKNIFLSLLAGLIGSVLFLSIYNRTYQKSFGIVRIDEIVGSHLKEYGSKNLTQDERDQLAKRFAKSLEVTITQISENERVILLVAPATVSKLPDYTSRIENDLKQMMNLKRKNNEEK